MEQDLRLAAKVQQALLPPRDVEAGRLRIAHAFHPCDDLAGDAVGIVPLTGDADRPLPVGRQRPWRRRRAAVGHAQPPAVGERGRRALRGHWRGGSGGGVTRPRGGASEPAVPDGPDAAVLHARLRRDGCGVWPVPLRHRGPSVAGAAAARRAAGCGRGCRAPDRHVRGGVVRGGAASRWSPAIGCTSTRTGSIEALDAIRGRLRAWPLARRESPAGASSP